MKEKIDFTTKWYLRIVAGIYVLMFIPMFIKYLMYGFQMEWLIKDFKEWYLMMPLFDPPLDITSFYYIDFLLWLFFPIIFWSFWIITFLRFAITGKHFYQ